MRRTLLACLLAFPTALPLHAADTDIVAQMGNTTLSLGEVKKLLDDAPPAARKPQDLEQLIRTEIIRKAVADDARRQSFDKKPEVASAMERSAEQALVSAYMNTLARPPADYPSEQDLKQFYEANKAALTTQTQFRVSQIYIAGTDAKAAKQADELYRQATRKKADFAEIARANSQHEASAKLGGDMGWLAQNDLIPAVREALGTLQKGEVGKPVAYGDGYHVLQLVDTKAPEILPLEKVKPGLVQNLRLRRAKEIEAAYLDAMLAKSPVMVNGIALNNAAAGKK